MRTTEPSGSSGLVMVDALMMQQVNYRLEQRNLWLSSLYADGLDHSISGRLHHNCHLMDITDLHKLGDGK